MLSNKHINLINPQDSEGEGLIGEVMGDKWIPFVCADKARVESLRSRAIDSNVPMMIYLVLNNRVDTAPSSGAFSAIESPPT